MIPGGLALLAVCVVLLLVRRFQQGRLQEIASAEASTAQGLADAATYVAERLGEPGSFSRFVKVKGVVKCGFPLTSEVARQPCVYYQMLVTREYEEYRETRSRRRRRTSKPHRRSETVASNSQRVPFWVEDGTARILVNPDHAEIDSIKAVDRFEPATGLGGSAVLRFGAFSVDLGNLLSRAVPSRPTTLGYRLQEKLLPLDRWVLVIGEVRDASGQLAIEKPREKGKRSIITLKSEEELIDSAGAAVRWLLVGAVASSVAGAALIVAGLIP